MTGSEKVLYGRRSAGSKRRREAQALHFERGTATESVPSRTMACLATRLPVSSSARAPQPSHAISARRLCVFWPPESLTSARNSLSLIGSTYGNVRDGFAATTGSKPSLFLCPLPSHKGRKRCLLETRITRAVGCLRTTLPEPSPVVAPRLDASRDKRPTAATRQAPYTYHPREVRNTGTQVSLYAGHDNLLRGKLEVARDRAKSIVAQPLTVTDQDEEEVQEDLVGLE